MKKNRLRAGIVFGIVMALFFIMQNIISADDADGAFIVRAVIIGLLSGTIAGFLFGWLTGFFTNSRIVKNATRIELGQDESIIHEGAANHFKTIEAVGGRLYLTTTRIVFRSHRLNIQNDLWQLSLHDLRAVEKIKTMGLFANGIRLDTQQGTSEKFAVENADEWVRLLSEKNTRGQQVVTNNR